MRRGEIWWADLPAPSGTRPVLLLSRNASYRVRSEVIVASVTTRERGIAAEVSLGPADGMPRACVANLDTINTVPALLLRERLTNLSERKMRAVDAALHYALALVD